MHNVGYAITANDKPFEPTFDTHDKALSELKFVHDTFADSSLYLVSDFSDGSFTVRNKRTLRAVNYKISAVYSRSEVNG